MTVSVACLPRWEEGAAQAGRFHGHLFDGKRVAQDVLGQVFEVGLGFGRDAVAGMSVKAARNGGGALGPPRGPG